jgi:hypothetical protein
MVVFGELYQPTESRANHSVFAVTTYVYHPVGNVNTTAQLNCGWHDNCDGIFTDPSKKGLDWQNAGNPSYTVWLRLKIYRNAGGSTDWVGRAQSFTPASGCKRIQSDLLRVNWSLVGRVLNQHSQASGTVYSNLYANGSGYQNEGVIGSMLLSGDNCMSTGPHTMQWYENSTGGNTAKNTFDLPYEWDCILCYLQYLRWSTHEWLFTYWTAP